MNNAKSSYDILNVPISATQNDIHHAYRKLALAWHPDRHNASSNGQALENFKALQDAYQKIKTPEKRAQYNQFLRNTKTVQNNGVFLSFLDKIEKIFWPSNQNKQG